MRLNTHRPLACLSSSLLLIGLLLSLPVQAVTATRSSSFQYDPVSGLLTKEIIEPNDPALCLVTEYTYDAYGNKTSVTTRNCNGSAGEAAAPAAGADAVIAPRTTTSTYDARGQFATATTNALGHTETRTFDAKFGAVLSLTGPNGLTTSWTYDSFGRKTQEARADGTTTDWNYVLTKYAASWYSMAQSGLAYYVGTKHSSNANWSYDYYDALNRKMFTSRKNFANSDWIDEGNVRFDNHGRVVRSYLPYERAASATAKSATVSYDLIGRPASQTAPNGGVTTTTYNGLVQVVTNALSQTKTTVSNAVGQTVSVTDTQNKVLSYTYDPFGNLLTTTDALGNVTRLTYDARGRKIGMVDPDMGTWSYAYNALGELIRQVDAKNQTITMTYDPLGRMLSRNEPDLISTWVYDTQPKGIGKLTRASSTNGYSRTHSYDALGRLSSTATTVDLPATPYVTRTTYDTFGRVLTQTYPTGFAVQNVYTADGYLGQVVNAATPTQVLWAANTLDAQGHLLQQTYGNGLVTQQVYDPNTGRVMQQLAGAGNAVQNTSYTYDSLGNLLTRTDVANNLTETYLYDTLNRVTSATATSGAINTVSSFAYDALGNITSKTGTGSYAYNASGLNSVRPHAVSGITGTVNGVVNPTFAYDANGNMLTGAGRTLTWTSFNIPSAITACPGNVAANCKTTSFLYNPEHERTTENQADGSMVVTLSPRYDTGLHWEKKSNFSIKDPKTGILIPAIEYEHYLYAGGLMFGKYITTTTLTGGPVLAPDGTALAPPKYEYYTKDHLGSIVAITNDTYSTTGAVIQRLSYDVWGKRRYPNGAADPNGLLNNPDMYHGYTGHEMLDDVGLIHMNGRLYDPMMGRFVSADPTIPNPGNVQSYNRYAYCQNNPFSCIDPSGFTPAPADNNADIVVRWVIVAVVSYYAGPAMTKALSASWGALGATGATMAGGAVSGAALGAFAAGMNGGDFNAILHGALLGGLTGGLFAGASQLGEATSFERYLGHAGAGCVSAMAGGGKCGSGAIAAFAGKWVTNQTSSWGIGPAQFTAATITGGVTSVIGGGKFSNGAVTAAFGYLYNAALSKEEARTYISNEYRPSSKFVEMPVGDKEEFISIPLSVKIPLIKRELELDLTLFVQNYGQYEIIENIDVERYVGPNFETGKMMPGGMPHYRAVGNITSTEKTLSLCIMGTCFGSVYKWK